MLDNLGSFFAENEVTMIVIVSIASALLGALVVLRIYSTIKDIRNKNNKDLYAHLSQLYELETYNNRRANAGTYASFNYDDRLMYELAKVRSELRNLNDARKKDHIARTDNHDFSYEELVRQIANMANIDNLFELLNTTKEEQFVQIKNVLADIVHTTRNPLSGVTAAMILLKKEVNLDQSTRELLDDVEKYIQQINESMNAYFKISQIGTVSFDEYDRINFKEELSNRCKLVVLSQGKKVNLRENIDEIWIDRNRAQIILLAVTCILENAIAFSPDNGLISIDVGCDDGELHIFIQNNGPVIEEAVINRIFDQGFSTRNSSGRGLSIAKKSVEEKLHGIILCENVGTDSGVKFSIVLEGVENENIK